MRAGRLAEKPVRRRSVGPAAYSRTQAGRTTMLNCLAASIPGRERVVSVEDVFELRQIQLQQTAAGVAAPHAPTPAEGSEETAAPAEKPVGRFARRWARRRAANGL